MQNIRENYKWSLLVKKEFTKIYNEKLKFYENIISKILTNILFNFQNSFIDITYLSKLINNLKIKYKGNPISKEYINHFLSKIWKLLNYEVFETIEVENLKKGLHEVLLGFKLIKMNKKELIKKLEVVMNCDYSQYSKLALLLKENGSHYPDSYIALDAHNHAMINKKETEYFLTFDQEFTKALYACENELAFIICDINKNLKD